MNAKQNPDVSPDLIREHCEIIHRLAEPLRGHGRLLVACFGEDPTKPHPKTGKPGRPLTPVAQTFGIGQVDEMVSFIAAMAAKPHRNVYVPLAVLRSDLGDNKKGGETDVVGVLGLVADFDDDDAPRWRERMAVAPPYVLQTSGDRFQAFVLFDQPYGIADIKPIALRLKQHCGCDHGTVDLSHVWRVPGTLNWPNAKKVAEGRSPEPQPVILEQPHTGEVGYSLEELFGALPEQPQKKPAEEPKGCQTDRDAPVSLLMTRISSQLRNIITRPCLGDRSKALFYVVKGLSRLPYVFGADQIQQIIEAYPAGIGEKYADRVDLAQEIERIRSKRMIETALRDRTSWKASLLLDDYGHVRGCVENAMVALVSAPEWQGVLGFDVFKQKIVLLGPPPIPTTRPGEWVGHYDTLTAGWLQRNDIMVSPLTAGQAVCATARLNEFHPVLDYLKRLKWDGVPRINEWVIRYLGAADTPYHRAVGGRFLIGLIRRIKAPGCKADCALILEGPQGALKSSAIAALVPERSWYTDEISEFGTKDAALQINGRWIVELGELEGMSRADVNKIKAFMSRQSDNFRPPYERTVVDHPRSSGFFGTCNDDEYLQDPTGGRRFWPIRCGTINLDAIRRDRDQLWAEAQTLCDAGAPHWLDTIELNRAAESEQSARYHADAWQPLINEFIRSKGSISVGEILTGVLHLPIEKWGQPEQNRVARCLRFEKWKRKQIRSGADRGKWFYYPQS